MSLKYEPSSEPLRNSGRQLFLNRKPLFAANNKAISAVEALENTQLRWEIVMTLSS
jgi:hypothetical protein